ncbi:MAG: hypothetical protein HZA28_00390 [Candidatus Omnitrophica bacterium]|nr:hypothetical protein [Candidatus Omnitrophota bacterium]
MSRVLKWSWNVYLAFFILLVARDAHSFFAPGTPEYLYWDILRAFDPFFWFAYTLTSLRVAVNAVHVLPLVFYIDRRRVGPFLLWKILFFLRLALDVTGHPYEAKFFASLYQQEPGLCLGALAMAVAVYGPSWWACGRYAFLKNSDQGDRAGTSAATACGRP